MSSINKDAILATLIGFGVGLLVTGIVLFGPSLFKGFPALKITLPKISLFQPKSTPTQTPKNDKPKEHAVTIDSPLSESLETNAKPLISGTTSQGATVIISSDSEDSVVSAAADGKYAGKVTLTEGKNTITVVSLSKDKKQAQAETVVYYTPEEI